MSAAARATKRSRPGETSAPTGEDGAGGAPSVRGSAPSSVVIQLQSRAGVTAGPPMDVPKSATPEQLERLLHELLGESGSPDKTPYGFYMDGVELGATLGDSLESLGHSGEGAVTVEFHPLSVYRVMPMTRCTDTLTGHTAPILHVSFSPDGSMLASGGGDHTVRFWDALTALPSRTCVGHTADVLCTAFAPDGLKFASADKSGEIRVWDPSLGAQVCRPLRGHKEWVTGLAWEPLHAGSGRCERLASAGRDGTVRVWNVRTGRFEFSLAGHTGPVEAIRWGGANLVYTASRDRTVMVFAVGPTAAGADGSADGALVETAGRGKVVRVLKGHGHRVNAIALSSDYVLRSGAYDLGRVVRPSAAERAALASSEADDSSRLVSPAPVAAAAAAAAAASASTSSSASASSDRIVPCRVASPAQVAAARSRWLAFRSQTGEERVVTCSDDFTLFLWLPESSKQAMVRLTGHQQAVNHIGFSPDGRFIASASFDGKVRLWDGFTGKLLCTYHGHVAAVYMVAWSPDSRFFATASRDSTCKVWRAEKEHRGKALHTLAGHEDEVYALDWSPAGDRLATGSRDRTVKIWRH